MGLNNFTSSLMPSPRNAVQAQALTLLLKFYTAKAVSLSARLNGAEVAGAHVIGVISPVHRVSPTRATD